MTFNEEKCCERALCEYNAYKNYFIGVDFDSTISPYREGEDVSDVLELVRRASHDPKIKICLWTIETSPEELAYKIEYCKKNGIILSYVNESPVDFGSARKPYFNLLLDDRAGLETAFNVLKYLIEHTVH